MSLTLTKLHQSLNLINNLVEVKALTNCIIYTPSNTRIPQSEQYIASVHSHISNVCNIVRCQIPKVNNILQVCTLTFLMFAILLDAKYFPNNKLYNDGFPTFLK